MSTPKKLNKIVNFLVIPSIIDMVAMIEKVMHAESAGMLIRARLYEIWGEIPISLAGHANIKYPK